MTTLYRVRSSIVVSVTAATLVIASVATVEMSGSRAPAPAPTPALAALDMAKVAGAVVPVPAPGQDVPSRVVQTQADLELVGASIANYDR